MTPMQEALGDKTGAAGVASVDREVWRLIRVMGPVTIRDLATLLAVPRRQVEEAVEGLRLSGDPIVGGNDGLHLSEDPAELLAYVDARRRRAVSIYLGTRALRKTALRLKETADAAAGLTLFGTAA